MELYNIILNEISSYATTETPISDIGRKYEFTPISTNTDDTKTGEYYTVYKAEKTEGNI
ncbi:hypothetical protein H7E67_17875 [Clostridium gasigenes]|uniref:hypothetical protein n=1 Tax=Clostridium gasigenes TaxID=94869 RepID=UPI0016256F59|nr:hypothetical protein [Clostridium gasigenes]MBB6625287.1 hypothetical protein [Clostridium gasigenes]